jgi:hypothetical protein
MIRTFHNYRIESAGRNVKLYRYENLDVTVSTYRRRTEVAVYHHGTLVAEPLWIRVQTSDEKLWDVDARDLDLLRHRDPKMRIFPASPAPQPWAVICEKSGS